MRLFTLMTAAATLSLLAASPVAAAEPHPPAHAKPLDRGPLKAGKSAGVRAAQRRHTGVALIGAGAAIVAVVVVAAGRSGNGQASPQMAPATTP